MDLYDAMWRRKSCRSYDAIPLSDEVLAEIGNAIAEFDRLYDDVELGYRFFSQAKGKFKVDAPHYLMITGNGQSHEQEAAGFLFEQLILWFDTREIGSVWLGSTIDVQSTSKGTDLLAIAFGKSPESVHRDISEFRRKDISEVTNAPDDIRMQAVHIAPSGMNTQPWYFEQVGDQVLVYERKLKAPISLAYKLSDVDMGIGLCHYAIAAKHEGKPFAFERTAEIPAKKGCVPFGIIRS